MPIYLIRHGQSEFNAAFQSGAADPMIFDAPLTAKGEAQAKQARIKVAELGIQHVLVSPFTRAIQTAQHIFQDDLPLNVVLGPHEQLSHSCDVGRSPAALKTDFPELNFDHLPDVWWHIGEENELGYTVEPQDIFAPRIRQYMQSIADLSPRPIALVAHGNVFKELVGYAMENCEIYRYSG
ncbi:MAG: histidine phosphatase family protein [Paracoccaceae bacterium]